MHINNVTNKFSVCKCRHDFLLLKFYESNGRDTRNSIKDKPGDAGVIVFIIFDVNSKKKPNDFLIEFEKIHILKTKWLQQYCVSA